MIRIVCQELESWYLGDLQALVDEYGDKGLRNLGRQAIYQDPDLLDKPSKLVKKGFPRFQKGIGARLMGGRLNPKQNRSHSFKVFVEGVARLFRSQFPDLHLEESS